METGASGLPEDVELDPAQRLDWLRLIRTDNVGPATFRTLIQRFGSAAAALDALPHLTSRGGATRTPNIPPRQRSRPSLARYPPQEPF